VIRLEAAFRKRRKADAINSDNAQAIVKKEFVASGEKRPAIRQ
jgi:hypothetical protein